MTVGELIAALQQYDPALPVAYSDSSDDWCCYIPAKDVSVQPLAQSRLYGLVVPETKPMRERSSPHVCIG